jgi:hypothetical protein
VSDLDASNQLSAGEYRRYGLRERTPCGTFFWSRKFWVAVESSSCARGEEKKTGKKGWETL